MLGCIKTKAHVILAGALFIVLNIYDTSRGPDQKQIIGLKAETENMTPEGSFISVTNYFIGHDRFITVECTFVKTPEKPDPNPNRYRKADCYKINRSLYIK